MIRSAMLQVLVVWFYLPIPGYVAWLIAREHGIDAWHPELLDLALKLVVAVGVIAHARIAGTLEEEDWT